MKALCKQRKEALTALVASLLATLLLAATLTACTPQEADNANADGYNGNPNVAVIEGESETIGDDPDMLADGTSGTSVHEGAGDETLQQDRVSGGANTGGTQSQNLDPLTDPLIEPKDVREGAE